MSGDVVPEPVFDRAEYEALLESIYADLAPLDPAGILRHEWVNARGCIARFDRMALEIRVLDVQECPAADLAIAAAVARVCEALCDPAPGHQRRLRGLDTRLLAAALDQTTRCAEATWIEDAGWLAALGLDGRRRTAAELWSALLEAAGGVGSEHAPALDRILGQGPLARRILARSGPAPDRGALRALYTELADCLRDGELLGA